MGFFTCLETRAREIDSLLCVGIDPHPEDLSPPGPRAALEYSLRLIDATRDVAVAYKPNMAFFERYGSEGIRVLEQMIAAVEPEIPVILDGKRGDIASSAAAYAEAAFKLFGVQAVTVNPYFGGDALQPFVADPHRGVFILCKTSNPGSADLQDLPIGRLSLYERVASLAVSWNRHNNIGLVVGATQPEALVRVRAIAPEMWILAPGLGAQGADLEQAVQAGLRADGLGLLLPVSRSISRSLDPHQAALDFREAINRARADLLAERTRKRSSSGRLTSEVEAIAQGLFETGCVRFGEFKLKSGLISPIYIDLRRLSGDPRILMAVARSYIAILSDLAFDRLAAIPYAALPIGTAISLLGGYPLVYPRKEAKSYGTKSEVEGIYQPGERVVVIDDLATTGESKLEAIEKLRNAGLQVEDVVVLIDRGSGVRDKLASRGYRLHVVFTLEQLLDIWERLELVPGRELMAVRAFLSAKE